MLISPHSYYSGAPSNGLTGTSIVMDAAGESVTLLGRISFNGTSPKTISANKGYIYAGITGATFNNPGTTLRVGIKEVSPITGLEVPTFDVYTDLIGGSGALVGLSVAKIQMKTGSKIINNNDFIAISFELISRVSPDLISLSRRNNNSFYSNPYVTTDSGIGVVKRTNVDPPLIAIMFDDGTIGNIGGIYPYVQISDAFDAGINTPNEIGNVLRLPLSVDLKEVTLQGSISLVADTNIVIYSDAFGTPVVEHTFTINRIIQQSSSSAMGIIRATINPPLRLNKDIDYAIVMRPLTVANDNQVTIFDLQHQELKDITPLGQNWSYASRNGNTGPFTFDPKKLLPITLEVDEACDAVEPIGFANDLGLILSPLLNFPSSPNYPPSAITHTILDAAGESITLIGNIRFSGTGSKTISSTGGKVYIAINSTPVTTFINPGSLVRIGLQDILSTGFEDNIFDVSGDLIGGTDPIALGSVLQIPMESGSKTINNYDLIGIKVQLVTRGGADILHIAKFATQNGVSFFPYTATFLGTLSRGISAVSLGIIEFDDGTIGHIDTALPYINENVTFGSITSPDEYGLLFTLQMSANLTAINLVTMLSTAGDVELVIYSDPLGVPTIEHTILLDKDIQSGSNINLGIVNVDVFPKFPLQAGIQYAITLKPLFVGVDTNKLQILRFNYPKIKDGTALGQDWSLVTRTDALGPFLEDPTSLPAISLFLDLITCTDG